MSALEALILGVVQGLTEFLPVSSSGHLVIVEALLGVERKGVLFEVAVHSATVVAVVVVYRRRLLGLLDGLARLEVDAWRYGAKLAAGTLPAAAAGLGARGFLEAQFDVPAVTGICLLVTGAIVITTRRTLHGSTSAEPTLAAALLIGCAQAVAILPGISRSGSTVAAALALGVAPAAAAEFSFLLGTIAIAGATALEAPELAGAGAELAAAVAVAWLAALASGIAAIVLFLRLLRTQHFHRFAYYAWALGATFLVWLAVR